ncbi:MAG TPA: DUF4832 domain-containing protein [Candidatus Hydrogenedentes bacterium]|nr:DUF4832 domain-containing protein [Candidatus Hydrogenedentota bacterium]HOL77248.1 DUF4832 domain-containing protein [Candidatus Hydrogenedentota bacterium]HPO86538.1 DUF4832 domain-containing protein [Candidatus Hydrogenedentota bacterium]
MSSHVLFLTFAITFYPVEHDLPLHNPLKGWVLIDHAIPGEIDAGRSLKFVKDGTPYEWFPNVAIMSTWAQVEKEPGILDWSLVDQALDYWTSLGKTIHLRFSTEDFGYIRGCPEWLYSLGVPQFSREGRLFPDYSHPEYQKHLERFLNAFFDKFGEDPRIETIDLRGYGEWGEWHSGFLYKTTEDRIAALKTIVDAWRRANRQRKYLMLSASYEWLAPWNSNVQFLPFGTSIYETFPPSYQDFLRRSVFDYAYSFPDVSLRRDGVGGAVFQEYDGRLIADFFQHYRKPICTEFFGGLDAYRGPSVVGFPNTKEGDDFIENAVDEAMTHHPNYCTVFGWRAEQAASFYNDYKELVIRAHRLMGYRFVPVVVELPESTRPGDHLAISVTWENRGGGRCYIPFRLQFYFCRGKDIPWTADDPSFDLTNLVSGETYRHTSLLQGPPDLESGTYEVRCALTNNFGRPVIELPIEGGDPLRRYAIGKILISSDAPGTTAKPQAELSKQGNQWTLQQPLAANGTYIVSFRYKVLRPPDMGLDSDNPGYFCFYAQNETPTRVAESRWFDRTLDAVGHKSFLVSTGSGESYRVIWESCDNGQLDLDQVEVETVPREKVVPLDVRTDQVVLAQGASIQKGNHVRASRERLQVNLPHDWFPFLKTNVKRTVLKRNTVYTIWFYFSARPQIWQGDYFYLAIRNSKEPDAPPSQLPSKFFIWTQRHTTNPVRRAYTFRTYAEEDTYLEWGIKNGGECEVFEVILQDRS